MPNKRKLDDRTVDAVELSGSLQTEIPKHAYERCRHFFMYTFFCKALIDLVNAERTTAGKAPWVYTFITDQNATHQIDTGERSDNVAHFKFDTRDAMVVNLVATGFCDIDAAHFCNLGIKDGAKGEIETLARNSWKIDLIYEQLKVICGNTRRLPKSLNVGPDKLVDRWHFELASAIQRGGGVPVTQANIRTYFDGAARCMKESIVKKEKAGKYGAAEMAKLYLECYSHDEQRLWVSLSGTVFAECQALEINRSDYLA